MASIKSHQALQGMNVGDIIKVSNVNVEDSDKFYIVSVFKPNGAFVLTDIETGVVDKDIVVSENGQPIKDINDFVECLSVSLGIEKTYQVITSLVVG